MAETNKLLLLALALIAFPSRAVAPEKITAIQEYIAERMGNAKGAQGMREAEKKVEEIEKRLLPLIFVFKRTGPAVDVRLSELEALKGALSTGQLEVNPYEDMDWFKGKKRETVRLCCMIRNDQRIAQAIQENVARGYPPMSNKAFEDLMQKIRESDRNSGGTLEDDEEGSADTSNREIPTGKFRPSARAGNQDSTPAQKMLNNIGYAPKVEPPAAPAAGAVPAANAPAGAAAPAPAPQTAPATSAPAAAPPAAAPPTPYPLEPGTPSAPPPSN